MAAVLGMKNKFKVIFEDKNNKSFDVDYILNDTVIAEKWFHMIKHLHRIPIDPVESGQVDCTNLKDLSKKFCAYAGIDIPEIDFADITQKELNALHRIYEDNHDRLSRLKNNAILYQFHIAIHHSEQPTAPRDKIKVGWGVKDGPLKEKIDCNEYFEPTIKKNFLYATESELGKTPYQYWANGEPADETRFNQLCKPHITLRAKFHISLVDIDPIGFKKDFIDWFSNYSKSWLAKYRLPMWRPIDEQCAPLLAHTDYKGDLEGLKFKKIIINK